MDYDLLSHLPIDWKHALLSKLETNYLQKLAEQVAQEYASQTVYPVQHDLWTTFTLTPLSTVKVVILGQDPYHGEGQAHGLAFSVQNGIAVPPSLRNIYKEITSDIGVVADPSGDLTNWATQGVLLLNSSLTVRAGAAGSHRTLGWERFTDAVIQKISDTQPAVVFILWGAYATAKQSLIESSRHLILTAPHPSPLSAHRGFLGCRHFSLANEFLVQHGRLPIVW